MSTLPSSLEMLRQRFATGLDGRLALLRSALDALAVRSERNDGPCEAFVCDLMRGFHNLAGIAGTFGFARLTTIAVVGEQLCESMREPPTTAEIALLETVLDSLVTAASAATSPGIAEPPATSRVLQLAQAI